MLKPSSVIASRGRNRSEHLRCFFAEGKLGGLHACGATFQYIVPLPNIFLTRLFSKSRLKKKDFQEIARLAWAQEVPSSNLGAPTNLCFLFPITYRRLHFC
jgi:hypothetical protein